MKSTIGESLRLVRIFHDQKQFELAKQLEISQSYLSEIESGRKEPSLELLSKYAEVFKTTSSALLFFHEDQSSIHGKSGLKAKVRDRMVSFLQRVADAGNAS